MIFFGIDPGISGGISAISEDGDVLLAEATPCFKISKNGKMKTEYDIAGMVGIFKNFDSKSSIVCQELTHAMPGNGGVSMYNFGRGHGIWEGIVNALGIRHVFCTPQKWKEMYPDISVDKLSKEERSRMTGKEISSWKRKAKSDAKKKSIEKAKSMFPAIESKIIMVKHDGIAESLLIANWLKINYEHFK